MKFRLINACLITATICALLLSGSLEPGRAAQKTLAWDDVATIKRVQNKPNRVRPRPVKEREEAPLLTIKYQVLKRGDGNTVSAVDPTREFAIGDQLKLAVTPNQDGFLYVAHYSVDNAGAIVDKPHTIFPDPRINNGDNKVQKNMKYIVPGYCQSFEDPNDCWWEITPPNGREYFTVIFSRDQIKDLPARLSLADVEKSGTSIDDKIIAQLKKESGQTVERADKVTIGARRSVESDGIYVQNTNKKDNEELIETIELKHPSGRDDDPSARARALVVKNRTSGMRIIVLKDNVEVDPSREFRANDEIRVKFQANFMGYVYIVNVTPGGKKCLLFPCSRTMANEVKPGQWYVLPTGEYVIAFDEEKGTEVLQVIMSRGRINYLDAAVKECCDPSKCCEIGGTASSAADELVGKVNAQQSGIVSKDVVAVVPPNSSPGGIRARSIVLSQGKDRSKDGSFVAVQDELGPGQIAVFEIRLKHN